MLLSPDATSGLESPLNALQHIACDGILCGEALEMLRRLPDNSVDAIVTDPPYSSGGQFRGDRTNNVRSKYVHSGTKLQRPEFGGDNRDQHAYAYWCALWLSECLRVAKIGAPIVMFTDWRQLPTTTDALQAGGWVWRGIAVWDKTEAARPAYGRYRNQAEYMVWGSKGPMRLNDGSACLPGVYRVSIKQSDKFHMTGKPTALMSALLRIVTPGGLVLDPFAGSGSTLVAAKAGGWRYLGIEREAEYVAICEARLAATPAPSLGSASVREQPKPTPPAKPAKKPRATKAKPTPPAPLWDAQEFSA